MAAAPSPAAVAFDRTPAGPDVGPLKEVEFSEIIFLAKEFQRRRRIRKNLASYVRPLSSRRKRPRSLCGSQGLTGSVGSLQSDRVFRVAEYAGPSPVVGHVYEGIITGIHDYEYCTGVYVEILPPAEDGSYGGLQGICPTSALAIGHVESCEDFIEGLDKLRVVYKGEDVQGRPILSRNDFLTMGIRSCCSNPPSPVTIPSRPSTPDERLKSSQSPCRHFLLDFWDMNPRGGDSAGGGIMTSRWKPLPIRKKNPLTILTNLFLASNGEQTAYDYYVAGRRNRSSSARATPPVSMLAATPPGKVGCRCAQARVISGASRKNKIEDAKRRYLRRTLAGIRGGDEDAPAQGAPESGDVPRVINLTAAVESSRQERKSVKSDDTMTRTERTGEDGGGLIKDSASVLATCGIRSVSLQEGCGAEEIKEHNRSDKEQGRPEEEVPGTNLEEARAKAKCNEYGCPHREAREKARVKKRKEGFAKEARAKDKITEEDWYVKMSGENAWMQKKKGVFEQGARPPKKLKNDGHHGKEVMKRARAQEKNEFRIAQEARVQENLIEKERTPREQEEKIRLEKKNERFEQETRPEEKFEDERLDAREAVQKLRVQKENKVCIPFEAKTKAKFEEDKHLTRKATVSVGNGRTHRKNKQWENNRCDVEEKKAKAKLEEEERLANEVRARWSRTHRNAKEARAKEKCKEEERLIREAEEKSKREKRERLEEAQARDQLEKEIEGVSEEKTKVEERMCLAKETELKAQLEEGKLLEQVYRMEEECAKKKLTEDRECIFSERGENVLERLSEEAAQAKKISEEESRAGKLAEMARLDEEHEKKHLTREKRVEVQMNEQGGDCSVDTFATSKGDVSGDYVDCRSTTEEAGIISPALMRIVTIDFYENCMGDEDNTEEETASDLTVVSGGLCMDAADEILTDSLDDGSAGEDGTEGSVWATATDDGGQAFVVEGDVDKCNGAARVIRGSTAGDIADVMQIVVDDFAPTPADDAVGSQMGNDVDADEFHMTNDNNLVVTIMADNNLINAGNHGDGFFSEGKKFDKYKANPAGQGGWDAAVVTDDCHAVSDSPDAQSVALDSPAPHALNFGRWTDEENNIVSIPARTMHQVQKCAVRFVGVVSPILSNDREVTMANTSVNSLGASMSRREDMVWEKKISIKKAKETISKAPRLTQISTKPLDTSVNSLEAPMNSREDIMPEVKKAKKTVSKASRIAQISTKPSDTSVNSLDASMNHREDMVREKIKKKAKKTVLKTSRSTQISTNPLEGSVVFAEINKTEADEARIADACQEVPKKKYLIPLLKGSVSLTHKMSNASNITSKDVLIGQGNTLKLHPGNITFMIEIRTLIRTGVEELSAQSAIDVVVSRGGRFMSLTQGRWEEEDAKLVLKKVNKSISSVISRSRLRDEKLKVSGCDGNGNKKRITDMAEKNTADGTAEDAVKNKLKYDRPVGEADIENDDWSALQHRVNWSLKYDEMNFKKDESATISNGVSPMFPQISQDATVGNKAVYLESAMLKAVVEKKSENVKDPVVCPDAVMDFCFETNLPKCNNALKFRDGRTKAKFTEDFITDNAPNCDSKVSNKSGTENDSYVKITEEDNCLVPTDFTCVAVKGNGVGCLRSNRVDPYNFDSSKNNHVNGRIKNIDESDNFGVYKRFGAYFMNHEDEETDLEILGKIKELSGFKNFILVLDQLSSLLDEANVDSSESQDHLNVINAWIVRNKIERNEYASPEQFRYDMRRIVIDAKICSEHKSKIWNLSHLLSLHFEPLWAYYLKPAWSADFQGQRARLCMVPSSLDILFGSFRDGSHKPTAGKDLKRFRSHECRISNISKRLKAQECPQRAQTSAMSLFLAADATSNSKRATTPCKVSTGIQQNLIQEHIIQDENQHRSSDTKHLKKKILIQKKQCNEVFSICSSDMRIWRCIWNYFISYPASGFFSQKHIASNRNALIEHCICKQLWGTGLVLNLFLNKSCNVIPYRLFMLLKKTEESSIKGVLSENMPVTMETLLGFKVSSLQRNFLSIVLKNNLALLTTHHASNGKILIVKVEFYKNCFGFKNKSRIDICRDNAPSDIFSKKNDSAHLQEDNGISERTNKKYIIAPILGKKNYSSLKHIHDEKGTASNTRMNGPVIFEEAQTVFQKLEVLVKCNMDISGNLKQPLHVGFISTDIDILVNIFMEDLSNLVDRMLVDAGSCLLPKNKKLICEYILLRCLNATGGLLIPKQRRQVHILLHLIDEHDKCKDLNILPSNSNGKTDHDCHVRRSKKRSNQAIGDISLKGPSKTCDSNTGEVRRKKMYSKRRPVPVGVKKVKKRKAHECSTSDELIFEQEEKDWKRCLRLRRSLSDQETLETQEYKEIRKNELKKFNFFNKFNSKKTKKFHKTFNKIIDSKINLVKSKAKMKSMKLHDCPNKDCVFCNGDYAKVVISEEELRSAGGNVKDAIPISFETPKIFIPQTRKIPKKKRQKSEFEKNIDNQFLKNYDAGLINVPKKKEMDKNFQ